MTYPRDLVGYGRTPPDPKWPGGARVAVQFVLNFEEGGESSILHGDAASETFLSEIVGATAYEGVRRGEIPSLKVGRRLLIPRAALDALLAQAATVGKGD